MLCGQSGEYTKRMSYYNFPIGIVLIISCACMIKNLRYYSRKCVVYALRK